MAAYTVWLHPRSNTACRFHRAPWDMTLQDLRPLIAKKLVDGQLPSDQIPSMSGSPGTREPCDACDRVIEPAQFMMQGATDGGSRTLKFHVDCAYLWDVERETDLSRADMR